MHIYFGLSLDTDSLPQRMSPAVGSYFVGPRKLLRLLEERLGLANPPDDLDFLRTEQYRQVLLHYVEQHPQAFFARSLEADALATAEALLLRRDELLEAGWDFETSPHTPLRLQDLAQLESIWRHQHNELAESERILPPGFSDRWQQVIGEIKAGRPHGIVQLHCAEPRTLLSPGVHRLFEALEARGLAISWMPVPGCSTTDGDLYRWQRTLEAGTKPQRMPPAADGSLLILKARRETHLAAYLAALMRLNPGFKPKLLQPDSALDDALHLEGLPSLGIPSASLARPTLQVLKLVTVFLWEPLDIYKIMEFVSLAVKPLDDGLSRRIAAFLARTPGLYSDAWFGMVNGYFDEMTERSVQVDPMRRQFEFWFRRNRVDAATERIDKWQAREIYEHLFQWAREAFEASAPLSSSFLTLAGQAKRIVELLDALPEEKLSYLELERIVRTIYEPAPVTPRLAEQGQFEHCAAPGAVIGPVDELVWWNFSQAEPDYFFSRWYPDELAYLASLAIQVDQPAYQNNRLVWRRKRPVLWTQNRLILCLPTAINGSSVEPHPLYGDLQAVFGDLSAITLDVDRFEACACWSRSFVLPGFTTQAADRLGSPEPFLYLRPIAPRETETPTSLISLFYYPHQWVFRHQIKLKSSSILSVVDGSTLLGNLAHRFIEELFEQDWTHWNKAQLDFWIEEQAPILLRKEGASLLLYGREPERVAFVKRMKNAAWSLIRLLRDNGWQVEATEAELEGSFGGIALEGRADLLLKRGQELAIVDLKWRGATQFQSLLRNQEDLQLALYAYLAKQSESTPHTAYFILEKAQILARNAKAFKEAKPLAPDVDHQQVYEDLYVRMQSTLKWRLDQLQAGKVEIRCEQTQRILEDHYGETLLDVLEMKRENAAFDDYKTLIRLIQ